MLICKILDLEIKTDFVLIAFLFGQLSKLNFTFKAVYFVVVLNIISFNLKMQKLVFNSFYCYFF